jgi:hypothetical protein
MTDFPVTLRIVREYSATILVPARDQAEADRLALAAYDAWRHDLDAEFRVDLGFPEPWDEHEMYEYDPEIDRKFRCVDCDKSVLGGEYYMVADELWAASGMAPNGGMLCLADLERRLGRLITFDDFTAIVPSAQVWAEHVAARGRL